MIVAIRGCNTIREILRENEKSVKNMAQNKYCIDALLFDENFCIHYIGAKRTNKGTDKQYIVGSSIHSTTCHI